MLEIRHRQGKDALISSLRIKRNTQHAEITVFNRGGRAGQLLVNAEDAEVIAERLLPATVRGEITEHPELV